MAYRPRPWAIRMPARVAGCWIATVLLLTGTAVAGPRETEEVKAVARARPAVVNIQGQKTERAPGKGTNLSQVNGMGTAVIVDPRGYMLTNYHVVEDVTSLRATLNDGRTVAAKVIAGDQRTDIAVLKIDVSEPLPVIELGTSSDLMVAEPVIAIGNPYGYSHTVTRGVISALLRHVPVTDDFSYHNLIQTDASINPGNSGGPLINAEGKMIGINVAVRVGAQGIAFAIPVDDVLEAASEMVQKQLNQGTSIGLTVEDEYCDDGRHLIVKHIQSGSGDNAIQPNDLLVSVAGHRVCSKLDVSLALVGHGDSSVPIEVLRDGQKVQTSIAATGTAKSVATASLGPSAGTNQKIWDSFGVRVQPVPKTELVKALGKVVSNYGGGLRVTLVKPNSAAANLGIQANDILVGIHNWQVTSESDLMYVLEQPEIYRSERKFYLGRDGVMMEGDIQLVQRAATSRRVNR